MTEQHVWDERLDVIERCITSSRASLQHPDRRLMTDNCTLGLISDLRAARAKVAELEALSKEAFEALPRVEAERQAASEAFEETSEALARANEALATEHQRGVMDGLEEAGRVVEEVMRAHDAFLLTPMHIVEKRLSLRYASLKYKLAQGSAAQKPEPQ